MRSGQWHWDASLRRPHLEQQQQKRRRMQLCVGMQGPSRALWMEARRKQLRGRA
jgi:hypothetical protein